MIIDYFISGITGKTYTGNGLLFGATSTTTLTIAELGTVPGAYSVSIADPVTPGTYLIWIYEGSELVGGGESFVASEYTGTVLASPAPTTTDFATTLTQSTNDHWNGSVCRFLTGVNQGKSLRIANYIGSSKVLEFSEPFPATPVAGDKFQIIGRID